MTASARTDHARVLGGLTETSCPTSASFSFSARVFCLGARFLVLLVERAPSRTTVRLTTLRLTTRSLMTFSSLSSSSFPASCFPCARAA